MDGKNRIFVLLFALALVGCGTKKNSNGPTKWNSFPVALYADPAIVSSANALADLNEAMSFWEGKAGRKLFDFRRDWSGPLPPYTGNPGKPDTLFGNVIYFEHSWPFAQNIAAQTVVFSSDKSMLSSVVMVHVDMGFCQRDCSGSFGTSERKVFAHELGHFLGLQHNNNISDIMYPEVQSGANLDSVQIDSATFSQLVN